MIDLTHRKWRRGVAAGAAIAALATWAQRAPAQTATTPGRLLQISLDSPPGVAVRIRPYTGPERPPEFVTCPPYCKLAGYAGYYQLEADASPDSGLRRLRKMV